MVFIQTNWTEPFRLAILDVERRGDMELIALMLGLFFGELGGYLLLDRTRTLRFLRWALLLVPLYLVVRALETYATPDHFGFNGIVAFLDLLFALFALLGWGLAALIRAVCRRREREKK